MTNVAPDSPTESSETPQEWQEPLTGPGVTIRDGYDFKAPLRALQNLLRKDTA